MRKLRKVMALLMTLAMVMGLSLTAFAANRATIRVNNLENRTTAKAAQVIVPDQKKTTGWKFVDNLEIRNAYANAFGIQIAIEDDYQNIIWKLIKFADPNADTPDGIVAATTQQIETALKAIPDTEYTISTDADTTNLFTVNTAGVYAIKAEPAEGSDTVYNPMAAYVAFTYTAGVPTLPDKEVVVNAKKTEVPVEKTVEDDDKATGISETVTYKVKTAVPYNVSKWEFTDNITGATYVVMPEGDEHEGQVKVSVKIGTDNPVDYYANVTGSGFVLDLSAIANNPNYRGAEVEFTYQAIVIGKEVNNEIQYDDEHQSDEVKLYTGAIIFTKYDEENNTLPGAGFKVSRLNEDETEYAIFQDNGDNTYTLTGWTNSIDAATEVFTGADGTLRVDGLDKGTYHFKETTAPGGYSINEEGKDVTFAAGPVSAAFETNGSMTDTKLAELPGTGGIGTTIFTIGGCGIMIAAAGLYFASRRKHGEN